MGDKLVERVDVGGKSLTEVTNSLSTCRPQGVLYEHDRHANLRLLFFFQPSKRKYNRSAVNWLQVRLQAQCKKPSC